MHGSGRTSVAHETNHLTGLDTLALREVDGTEMPVEHHAARAGDIQDEGAVGLVAAASDGAGVDGINRSATTAHEVKARMGSPAPAGRTHTVAVAEIIGWAESPGNVDRARTTRAA